MSQIDLGHRGVDLESAVDGLSIQLTSLESAVDGLSMRCAQLENKLAESQKCILDLQGRPCGRLVTKSESPGTRESPTRRLEKLKTERHMTHHARWRARALAVQLQESDALPSTSTTRHTGAHNAKYKEHQSRTQDRKALTRQLDATARQVSHLHADACRKAVEPAAAAVSSSSNSWLRAGASLRPDDSPSDSSTPGSSPPGMLPSLVLLGAFVTPFLMSVRVCRDHRQITI